MRPVPYTAIVRRAIVRIETAERRALSQRTAGNPMSAKEVEAKALDLMMPVLGGSRAPMNLAPRSAISRVSSPYPVFARFCRPDG